MFREFCLIKVINNINNLSSTVRLVATIGNFDGIHRGHQLLLKRMLVEANSLQAKLLIISFQKHTKSFNHHYNLIGLKNKCQLLENLKIDYLLEFDFNQIKEMSYQSFLEMLISKINLVSFVASKKLKIGKNRAGEIDLVVDFLHKKQIKTIVIEPLKEKKLLISSSEIRYLIQGGEIKKANHLLGWNFFIEGKVIRGKQLGTKIGIPTINIAVDQEIIFPKEGVYSSEIQIGNVKYYGLSMVGFPSIGDKDKRYLKHMETYVFNYHQKIYGRIIKIYLLKYIRSNQKINSIAKLPELISSDIYFLVKKNQ